MYIGITSVVFKRYLNILGHTYLNFRRCMNFTGPYGKYYCHSLFENDFVNIDNVKSAIKDSGIPQTDFRIQRSLQLLDQITNSSKMGKSDFLTLMEETEFKMIDKILCGDIAIPDFQMFVSHIKKIFENCVANGDGEVASYIPQLAKFSPHLWGVSICTVDGQRFSIGDSNVSFCMQSTSKPINYALTITELGAFHVHEFVGYESSGASFNTINLNHENKPHNPLINAGALVICSLIKQSLRIPERFDYILRQFKRIAGYNPVGFNNSVYMSEKLTADRNFALAYYMRENNCFAKNSDLHETLDLYFQLCSLEIDCDALSVIASTFANGGLCPTTEEKVLSAEAVRDTLCLMHSCGMYDYSGQFAFKCGLPSKSGVSGACLIVIPNLMGIGLWSPPLDKHGNSCRALQFCMELVQRFNFHHFDSLLNHHNKIDPRKLNKR